MRKEFAQCIEKIALKDKEIIFLTGDLGFMALENVRNAIGDRFINVGVSEQNMISMAASLAYDGFKPICYSIAPFAVFRPAEQIRVDVCLHNLNVKIVGNGGGYGYGIMGATHHALEDIAVISSFQNMKCFVPFCNEDVAGAVDAMFNHEGPSYLRLGYGLKPENAALPQFSSIRKIHSGDELTIIGVGPVTLNVFDCLEKHSADVFVLSNAPIFDLNQELTDSIKKTKRILFIEEHVKRGGLAENIALLLLENQIVCKFKHLSAQGYPNGLYGNQQYHQQISQLDAFSINTFIEKLIEN